MTFIFLERVKLWRVALPVAIVIFGYLGAEAAGFATGTQRNERPPMNTPVQVDNDPRLPVVITEAKVGVTEPYDLDARFPTHFPSPPRKLRTLWFTLKLKNQGDRPVNGLKFAIQSPLFSGNSSSGLQGKKSSLMGNEEVSTTFGSSVDDREDVSDLARNIRVKPLEVSYESETSVYDASVSRSLDGAMYNFESGMQINVIAFHELRLPTPRRGGETNQLRLIRAEPPKNDASADHFHDAFESVYQMSEALKPTILYKEKAEYTPEARANKARGSVILNVIFGADGAIRVLRVVHGLPHGLTGQALKAAQRVRFEPAVKDGKPVDVRGDLEFSFELDR
jgi:TonB family protein